MDKDRLKIVQQEMVQMGCDIKVESLLMLALEDGLSAEDFMISNDSLFEREYRKDLVSVEMTEDPRKKQFLQITLSRSGIYDQLPEGLFFQSLQKRGGNSASDMVADYKANKKKEAEFRRFFMPFENDFFWQKLQIEQEEGKLLGGLQSGILNDYFIEFWNIPRSIPQRFIVPLILLLPYAHQVAGNLQLTAECLEQLILEQVEVKQKRSVSTQTPSELTPGLGEAQLGFNMLCGESFLEDCPIIEFEIGPLQRSLVSEYLQGGERFELLEIFSRFFVPAGLDIEFSFKVPVEKQNMTMETEEGPVLGYSSIL